MALEDLMAARRKKLEALINAGIEPYPYRFEPNAHTSTIKKEFADLGTEEEKREATFRLAGRIVARRDFGKLVFLTLLDGEGKLQLVVKKGETDEKSAEIVKKYLDVGDIVGVEGFVFRTKRGELSLMVKELIILSKSLRPLPEKWHGLEDRDERYRRRYVDLIVNPESREVFKKKAKIFKIIREIMEEKGFLEMDIPILQPVYGGAYAKPFKTYSYAWKRDLFLSISPELYLKKLLVGGFERVYALTKAFRNEDVDRTHNPEFNTFEAYAAYWDYNDVMELTEEIFERVALELYDSTVITYGDKEIDLSRPWKRLPMKQALKDIAKIDVDRLSYDEIKELLAQHEIEMPYYNRGLAIAELFEATCEDKLIQPTFVTDHPKETTPLCKLHREDPALVERFELYINGVEMANAYSELNDPLLQRKLFEEQEAERAKHTDEYQPNDRDFLEALEYGMPPAGGLGIGIDRLVMLMTNRQSIRDVIPFPQLRPSKEEKHEGESKGANKG